MSTNPIQNPSDNHIEKVAEELATLSGTCEEIKEIQLNCATADDLTAMSKNLIDGVSEKVDGFMQEGILPKFEEIKTALKEPSRYIIETSSESVANLLYKNFAEDIKKELGENVEKMIQKGVVNIYADSTRKLNNAADRLERESRHVSDGHWWLVVPRWVYFVVGFFILAAIGFSIGFFNVHSDNEKYKKMEWLYRYERISYDKEGIQNMMLREEAMMVGTQQEQDSIKRMVVNAERKRHAERTHTYFRPSDNWTPESKSFW